MKFKYEDDYLKFAITFFIVSILITMAIVLYNFFISINIDNFNKDLFTFLKIIYFIDICLSIYLIVSSKSYFTKIIISLISFLITTPIFFATYYLAKSRMPCIIGAKEDVDAIFFSYSILTGNGYFQYSVHNNCANWVIIESILGVIYLALIASILYGWTKK